MSARHQCEAEACTWRHEAHFAADNDTDNNNDVYFTRAKSRLLGLKRSFQTAVRASAIDVITQNMPFNKEDKLLTGPSGIGVHVFRHAINNKANTLNLGCSLNLLE